MDDNGRVSVVIAVHDAHSHLETAVRSVLASELRENEVIVVANGATDSAASISAIRDARVIVVRLRPGTGASRPRNVGIARARAPYVAFLDPQDMLKPDYLSAAAGALDEHPEAGFAFADFEQLDEAGSLIPPPAPVLRTLKEPGSQLSESGWHILPRTKVTLGLLNETRVGVSGLVMRKPLLTELGPFDESAFHCAELDLWFRLAHRCDALYWDQVGHSHRPGSGALMNTAERAHDCIAVLQREKRRHSDRSAHRQLDRRIAQNYADIGYEERRRRRKLRSIAMFAYAFATYPDTRWLRGALGQRMP